MEWLKLALKDVLITAADSGYDGIMFADSEVFLDHYQTNWFQWIKEDDVRFRIEFSESIPAISYKQMQRGEPSNMDLDEFEQFFVFPDDPEGGDGFERIVDALETIYAATPISKENIEKKAPKIWEQMEAGKDGEMFPRASNFERFTTRR